MQRDLAELSKNVYELLVIGGGIYGACIAWEASLRGLSVALLEKGDFGEATSANSLKTIHGGLRYLQHADLKRMRESIYERTTLMRISPHLIHPLPVLLPTYGRGIKGKEVLSVALFLNDLISCDRNWIKDPQKHIPNGRIFSKQECQSLLPGISSQGLTGGALFYDAQVYNSERLTISFLRKAQQTGAAVANYVEVIGFMQSGNCVTGVRVRDSLTGDRFDIQAKTVVNTSGPWVNRVLGLVKGSKTRCQVSLAKAMNLVIRRPLFKNYAVGISSQKSYSDPDAVINKGSRLLFVAPWRGKSMIGTNYSVYDGDPDDFQVTENDIQAFLNEINQAYPPASLKMEDVDFVHGGLLPRSGIEPKTGEPLLSKHYQLHDHSQEGLLGLISVVGVKYTTARDVAQKVIDRVFKSWGKKPPKSLSATTPVYGGEIEKFETFLDEAIANAPYGLDEEIMRRLVYNYGSAYPEVLKYLESNLDRDQKFLDNLDVIKAEVIHGVREEMAQKLTDVVFRRTELGSAGYPGNKALNVCAQTMAAELGWSLSQIQQELQEVSNASKSHCLVREEV